MKIYVAHVYRQGASLSKAEGEANVHASIEVGRQLILKGHNPFIPNLYHWVHKGWEGSPGDAMFLRLVSDWIQSCDALLVAQWDEQGVKREMKIAEALGKKIYWSIDEVP